MAQEERQSEFHPSAVMCQCKIKKVFCFRRSYTHTLKNTKLTICAEARYSPSLALHLEIWTLVVAVGRSVQHALLKNQNDAALSSKLMRRLRNKHNKRHAHVTDDGPHPFAEEQHSEAERKKTNHLNRLSIHITVAWMKSQQFKTEKVTLPMTP